jgi:uncharacterized protein YjbI with pentapeptide repeats
MLFECEAESMSCAVKLAVKAKANLSGADLRWANLREADLRGANLRGANLSGAYLRGADLRWADLSGADLRWANLSEANLSEANLSGAYLRGANLSEANLRGADLDYSCWPLWCGSKKVKVDMRIVYQLIAHICVLDCDDKVFKRVQKFLLPFAKKFHRWSELGEK